MRRSSRAFDLLRRSWATSPMRTTFFNYALNFGRARRQSRAEHAGGTGGGWSEFVDYAGNERRSLLVVRAPLAGRDQDSHLYPGDRTETTKMRAVLPKMVTRADAICNPERASLLQAVISEKRFDLLIGFRDRLHQPYRAPLAPGLMVFSKLNDETYKHPGQLGTAISGADRR
ncbi:MAG: hypothetical protein IPG76_21800 [Acidobacteria bacterium]|nr:hypothetical protein [Acidobacteriota bacterium]